MTRYLPLFATLLLVVLLYSRESTSYFCGFDDLNEWHRVAFTEHPGLADDFTTHPYLGYKYRPLSWTIDRLTYEAGHGNPAFYRIRNVGFHLLNVILIYAIAIFLFESPWVAGTAALLFGIHPLANQSIAGAVWTITPAAFLLLLALYLFLLATRKTSGWLVWLTLSMLTGWLGVLMYDAVFFFFGLTYSYVGVQFLAKRKRLERPFLVSLTVLTGIFLFIYFWLRAHFLPPGSPHPVSLTAPIKNTVIYTASFFLLIDPILANDWFDTPLPAQALAGNITPAWLAVTVLPAVCILLLLIVGWRQVRERLAPMRDWPRMAFLALGIAGAFSPFLLFTDHASETYIYLPLLFVTLLLSKLICQLLRPEGGRRRAYIAVMSVILVLFCCANVARNNRVAACGAIVRQVLTSLPSERLHNGPWHLVLASVPGEEHSNPYGMYGYKGVDALGLGEYGAGGVQAGLQAATFNKDLSALVTTPAQFQDSCAPVVTPQTMCFWVHEDGSLSPPGRTIFDIPPPTGH